MSLFDEAARLIERGITSHAFPAASIEVGRRERVLWRQAFGHLTYAAGATPASHDTIFDLASLTKVIATATLVMRAVDAGTLALDDRVADRLPAWRGPDREHVTIADLLEHASGLTAYLPFFRDHHGRAEFERAICTLPLEYAPRAQSIYSDLGFMLLAFILEDVNRAPFAAQFDQIFRLKAEGHELLFNPPRDLRARCAPTELDLWRGRLLQGEVHDENTWALGGAAGHAGLFGTAASVGAFARQILDGLLAEAGSRQPEAGSWKPEAGSRTPWRASRGNLPCREARARSGGTRWCRPRHAARACRRARSATRDSPARRSGSIRRRISTLCCSPTACTRRATTIRSNRCDAPSMMRSSTNCRDRRRGDAPFRWWTVHEPPLHTAVAHAAAS